MVMTCFLAPFRRENPHRLVTCDARETSPGFREFLATTGYNDARGAQPPGTALWCGAHSLLCVSCLIETGEALLSFTWQAR